MFEKEELKRYNRQIILPELGLAGQQKLKAAKVLVVGAGGLGCPVLQYLVAAGVGTLGIIDDDVVDESNLHRQILYSPLDLGLKKALIAQAKLKLFNPHVNILAYHQRLTDQNIYTLLEGYDLIIDGSDNFPTRYLVNDACVKLNKPLVFGAIYKFEGQVSVFNYLDGPNYRDLFPEAPAAGEVPSCGEIGVIGVLPGIIGTLMANEAIKIICGIGETLSGRLLCVDALSNAINIFKVNRASVSVNSDARADLSQDISYEPVCSKDEVGVDELNSWLKSAKDEICLVDVRETYEFEDYNIGGINIPLDELVERLSELPADKTKVVFCCQTGHRSKQAVYLTQSLIKAQLFSLSGGIYNTL
jgi:adenylyltransferase/sulfurtransferase